METNNPKKIQIISGIIAIIGFGISILAFQQDIINPFIILSFGLFMLYFGFKIIYKTKQGLK